MASTTFTNGVTLSDADWFNDVNRLQYTILGDPADASAVRTALGFPASSGSSLVGFLQSGTGATSRTLQDKERDIVSVKDFGAVGDGVTDDATAVQAALTYVGTNGGILVWPKGTYLLGSQVTLTRGTAVFNQLAIIGYGAELITTGAISALRVSTGTTPHQTVIEGLKVNHRGNATATAGFELVNTTHVTLRNCDVEAHGVSASYAACLLRNSTAADPNTGCFWTTIDNITIRKRSGADVGNITNGILLQGAANATTIVGGALGNCTSAIKITPEAGQTYIANGVLIQGVWIEGNTTGVDVVQSGSTAIAGLRLINNRLESLTTFLSLTGTTTMPVVPIYLSGNFAISSVTTYISNTNSQYVTVLDTSVTPDVGPQVVRNAQGLVIGNTDASKDALTLLMASTGTGFALKDAPGTTTFLTARRKSHAGSSGILLKGSFSPYAPMGLSAISGIAARDQEANNFVGSATFSAATTVTVTFAVNEVDANYTILYDSPANLTLWTTAKGTTGFTVNASASNSNTVRWILIRHQ